MVSIVVGGLFVVLGLFAGVVLVVAPLVTAPMASSAPALWLLFPLFFVVGYALVVVGTRQRDVVRMSFVLSASLLPLALVAAVALVLAAASLLQPAASTASWWYVLVVAGFVGVLGTAAGGGSRGAAIEARQTA